MTPDQLGPSFNKALVSLDVLKVNLLLLIFQQLPPALAWHLQRCVSCLSRQTNLWLDLASKRFEEGLLIHRDIVEGLELCCKMALPG